jgi:hypothetical protein
MLLPRTPGTSLLKILANGVAYGTELQQTDPSVYSTDRVLVNASFKVVHGLDILVPNLRSRLSTFGFGVTTINNYNKSVAQGFDYVAMGIYDPSNMYDGWTNDWSIIQTELTNNLKQLCYSFGDYSTWSTYQNYPTKGVKKTHMCQLGHGSSATLNGYYQDGALIFDTGDELIGLFIKFRDQY